MTGTEADVLNESELIFPGSASGRNSVLPVTTNGTARGRDTPVEKQFVPTAGRGGRRHGQTHFVFASRPATSGRLTEDYINGVAEAIRIVARHYAV